VYEACCTLPDRSPSQPQLRITQYSTGRHGKHVGQTCCYCCYCLKKSPSRLRSSALLDSHKAALQVCQPPSQPSKYPRSTPFLFTSPTPPTPGCESVREEASSLGLGVFVSEQHHHPPATGPATCYFVSALHHQHPGACPRVNPHPCAYLPRHRRNISRTRLHIYYTRLCNHGCHCDRVCHCGIRANKRATECHTQRSDVTGSYTILQFCQLTQEFDQCCTSILTGNTSKQWRRTRLLGTLAPYTTEETYLHNPPEPHVLTYKRQLG